MGSSGTTELLFFIGAVVVATTIVAVLASGIQSISTGVRERSDSISDNLKSDIAIVNDPTEVPDDPVLIYIKNTGVAVLNENYTNIVLDGEIKVGFDIIFLATPSYVDDSAWGPGEIIQIEIDADLDAGLHTVQASYNGDVSDRMDFEIE